MSKTKTIHARIKQVLAKANQHRRLVIVEIPEEMEIAPHWLLWVALLALAGLIVAGGWQLVSAHSNLQVYLPFL